MQLKIVKQSCTTTCTVTLCFSLQQRGHCAVLNKSCWQLITWPVVALAVTELSVLKQAVRMRCVLLTPRCLSVYTLIKDQANAILYFNVE